MSDVKYPEVTVELIGTSSHAMSIMGLTKRALVRAGVNAEEIKKYIDEATSGDYDNVIQTTMRWVNVE